MPTPNRPAAGQQQVPKRTLEDIMDLSDDDLLNMPRPPAAEEPAPAPAAAPAPPATQAPAAPVEGEQKVETPAPAEEPPPAEEPAEPAQDPVPPLQDPAVKGPDAFQEGKEGKNQPPAQAPEAPAAGEAQPKPGEKQPDPAAPATQPAPAAAGTTAIDPAKYAEYKSFFEKVTAEFKANGKQIKIESPDDIIRLMQQGANYTQKMQALQPQRKLLMMLENNGLNNEAALSYAIDAIVKKNPEAIKKLMKDAKIDTVDFDPEKVNYQARSHAVTDQEAAIASAIEELQMVEGGSETLRAISGWDPVSKEELWKNPGLFNLIHAQRVNGIYGQITTEMARLQMLGQLSPSMPFTAAYRTVGDAMHARGAFKAASPAAPGAPAPKPGAGTPVAVRPASAPAPTAKDPRVSAAAPTRTAPRATSVPTNYLQMSDEDFLKQPPPKFGTG